MTAETSAANAQPVKHRRVRNTFIAVGVVIVAGLLASGGYWVWTQQDSGTQMRAQLAKANERVVELTGQLAGKKVPDADHGPAVKAQLDLVSPKAPAAAPAAKGISPQEAEQLNALLLKQAVNVLPPPDNGNVGVMVQTAKLGTPPSKECRELVGTKHDPETKGTMQIWKRC